MSDFGLLIARIMMSLVFLWSGLDKALHWSAGLAEIGDAGLPAPMTLLATTVMTQLGGGLSLALGLWARAGAFLLAGFTVFATVLFHDFWNAGIMARKGRPTACSTSSGVFTVLSTNSLRNAIMNPAMRPSMRPNSRFRGRLGESGLVGT